MGSLLRPRPQDNDDLWGPIITCAQGKQVKVVKIRAHTGLSDWLSRANDRADQEAKRAVTIDHAEIYSSLTHQVETYLHRRSIQLQIMIFQIKAATFEFNFCQQQDESNQQVLRDQMQQMAEPSMPILQLVFDLSPEQCSRCKYNPDFLFRLAQWAKNLSWEQNPQHSTSYFELMLEYIYETRTYPPFAVSKHPDRENNHQKLWLLRDQHPGRDFQGYNCQDLLTAFIRTANWGYKHLGVSIFPNDIQPQVNSLHIFSYKGFTSGIRHRAKLNHAAQIDNICRNNLHYRTDLRIPIPHVAPS